MNVYRIKHKPTGRYLTSESTLTENGTVFDWKPTIREDLGVLIKHTWQGKREFLETPAHIWEIKEYVLED